jgi:hypothetical protein
MGVVLAGPVGKVNKTLITTIRRLWLVKILGWF